jgi:hypothetical protein
LRIQVFPQIT